MNGTRRLEEFLAVLLQDGSWLASTQVRHELVGDH
jgi:hypothetical protein